MIPISIDLPDGFLDAEIRNGYEVTSKAKKVWAVELDLLAQLDRVCKKHNLKYFGDCGTLLGAVREHGFIPWDDEIDVVMLREDYDYLVHNCTNEFSHPYFLQSAYSDPGYLRSHAQLRNTMTTAILPNEMGIAHFNQGIFLDIFPLDYLPETMQLIKRKYKKTERYRTLFHMKMYNDYGNTLKKKIKTILLKILFLNDGKLLFHCFENACKEKHGSFLDKVSYYWDLKQYKHIPVSVYSKIQKMLFEFTEIPAPIGFELLLTRYYGSSFMTPVQKKAGHQEHGELIVDPEKSYIEYL